LLRIHKFSGGEAEKNNENTRGGSITIKVIRVNKHYSLCRGIIVYKRYRTFDYKILRDMPLCHLDNEEFKFVLKLLLTSEGETK